MRSPTQLYSDAELQQRMDNFLMLRYDSEQEITDAMNVEIKQLNYDRRLLEGSRSSTEAAFRGQIKLAANQQRSGQPVPAEITAQISDLKKKLAENGNSLNGLKQREDEIRAEFQKQLDRYRHLQEEWAEEASG
jgi:phage-related protein